MCTEADGSMQTIELADGGSLLYDEAFLPLDLADRYFAELQNTSAWEQKKVPERSMSSTDLQAFGDICSEGT